MATHDPVSNDPVPDDRGRRVVDAALAALLEQPGSGRRWVHGRELRFALDGLDRAGRDAAIASCVPEFLTPRAEEPDTYTVTLDGILAVSDERPRKLLGVMLAVVADRYPQKDGRRQRVLRWCDIAARGFFPNSDFEIGWHVCLTAGLADPGGYPPGASQDPKDKSFDYEFWLKEADLELMSENRFPREWAKLQRARANPSVVVAPQETSAATADHDGAAQGSLLAGASPKEVTRRTKDDRAERFLTDLGAFVPVCDAIDVAGVAGGDDARTLLSLRVTAGRASGDPFLAARQRLGSWTIFRFRSDVQTLASSLQCLVEGRPMKFESEGLAFDSMALSSWHANDFVRQDTGIFGPGRTARMWLGNSGKRRAFLTVAEHGDFTKLVNASAEFHNVEDLVSKLHLRQQLSSDDQCAVRFEIEAPLYYVSTEWRQNGPSIRFRKPPGLALDDFRVKWKTSDGLGAGVANLIERDGFALVEPQTPARAIDGTLLYGNHTLLTLPLDRPSDTALPSPIPADDEEDLELDLTDTGPDYSRFDTTRLSLRRSAKKQVNRNERIYKIVARDIHDAIWCFEHGCYKVAAILAGGILEVVLQERLTLETPQALQAAFQAKFPGRQVHVLARMTLQELVGVAEHVGRLRHDKLYDGIRDWRNLVHPAAEIREGSVDANHANIALTAAIMLLKGSA